MEHEELHRQTCIICHGTLKIGDSTRKLPCKHQQWHEHCILEWFSRGQATCPICRAHCPCGVRDVIASSWSEEAHFRRQELLSEVTQLDEERRCVESKMWGGDLLDVFRQQLASLWKSRTKFSHVRHNELEVLEGYAQNSTPSSFWADQRLDSHSRPRRSLSAGSVRGASRTVATPPTASCTTSNSRGFWASRRRRNVDSRVAAADPASDSNDISSVWHSDQVAIRQTQPEQPPCAVPQHLTEDRERQRDALILQSLLLNRQSSDLDRRLLHIQTECHYLDLLCGPHA